MVRFFSYILIPALSRWILANRADVERSLPDPMGPVRTLVAQTKLELVSVSIGFALAVFAAARILIRIEPQIDVLGEWWLMNVIYIMLFALGLVIPLAARARKKNIVTKDVRVPDLGDREYVSRAEIGGTVVHFVRGFQKGYGENRSRPVAMLPPQSAF